MSPPSKFRVQPATHNDIPLILQMTRSLAIYEKLPHLVTASEASLCDAFFGANPRAEAAVGYAGDKAAGMAVFFHTFSTFLGRPSLYLEDIFVEEKWRGCGLGQELMRYVARLAVTRGCARLEWSVLNWNEPAIRFYRQLRATPMDEWIVYRLSGDELTRLAADA